VGKFFLGTSGFSYDHWGGGFFYPLKLPKNQWFSFYCQQFNSVELNASFYRLPKKEVFGNWRQKAGEKFVFSVKGSRFITHVKKLKDCQEAVKVFFEAVKGLKLEVGSWKPDDVVLWQLPPSLKVNKERLESFLKILPPTFRHAFEFRDSSWVTPEILTSLLYRNEVEATVVFQDWADWPRTKDWTGLDRGLKVLVEKLPFVYLRFQGSRVLYSSGYTEKELKNWADYIKEWLKSGKDVYTYFNNDALGYAISNAKTLKKLVE